MTQLQENCIWDGKGLYGSTMVDEHLQTFFEDGKQNEREQFARDVWKAGSR